MNQDLKCHNCLTDINTKNEIVFCELCMLGKDEEIEKLKNEIKKLKKNKGEK